MFMMVLFVQFNPYMPQQHPRDPRVRRAEREQMVARFGAEARGLIEAYDEAVAALECCSVPVGKKLSVFYAQGGLDKFPRPRSFLAMLARQRGDVDDVCLWALQPQNVEKLQDVDYFDAFLAAPLEYALALRSLADGAAQVRTSRLPPSPAPIALPPSLSGNEVDPRATAVVAGMAVIGIGMGLWIRKRLVKA